MAGDRRDLRRAARELLSDELAGGRYLVAPRKKEGARDEGRGTRETALEPAAPPSSPHAPRPSPPAPDAADDVSERLKRYRAAKAAQAAQAAAGAAAQPPSNAEAGLPPKGLSSSRDVGIFGNKPFTDPAKPPAERLAELAKLTEGCQQCELYKTRTKLVFGDGVPGVELLFVGEAPGADEDASGVPFVGRAGPLLNKIIAAMGLKREQVYIGNVLKCRPPDNRTPLPGEAAACWPYLREQIEIIKPKLICALGSPAARTLLGTEESIGRLRGAVHDYHGTPLIATYHPAYLLRSPGEKAKVWEDMKIVLKLLGRPVPKPGR